MKRLFTILAIIFFTAGMLCSAQLLPHQEEAVVLKTKSGDINGKILLPNSDKKCPVAILIAGSGPTDMDGNSSIANVKPNSLKLLAESLADAGIASLRFDKRGIASSANAGKEEYKLRFDDYVSDVVGWIDLLAKDKRFTEIDIIGHSEGSLIGMLACKERSIAVKKFISLAGAGRPAYEIIEEQIANQTTSKQIQDEVIAINDSLRSGLEVKNVPVYLQSLFRPSVQPYLISWYKNNPQTILSGLSIPVLIVQGKTDIQVSSGDAELLKKSSPDATLLLIDGMNHVLKECDSTDQIKQMAVYTDPSLPLDKTLTSAISSFITDKK